MKTLFIILDTCGCNGPLSLAHSLILGAIVLALFGYMFWDLGKMNKEALEEEERMYKHEVEKDKAEIENLRNEAWEKFQMLL